jgi:hypothetical protein
VPPNTTGPLTDAQHFTCSAGICAWKGCVSTDECKSALQTTKVSCEQPEGAPAPTCVPTCSKAEDCVTPGNPLGDAGHYNCVASRCEWKGCRSTSECASALQSNKVVCE